MTERGVLVAVLTEPTTHLSPARRQAGPSSSPPGGERRRQPGRDRRSVLAVAVLHATWNASSGQDGIVDDVPR